MKLVLVTHKVKCSHCGRLFISQEGVKIFELNEAGGRFVRDAKESEIVNSALPREHLIVTRDVNRCSACWQEEIFVMPQRPKLRPTEPAKAKVNLDDFGI